MNVRLTLVMALMTAPSLCLGQQQTFIIRRGADTVAVEQFTRAGGTLSGVVTQKNGVSSEYVVRLRPDSSVERIDMRRKTAEPVSLGVAFEAHAVDVVFSQGGESESASIATPERAAPFFAVSFALCEQIAKAANLKPTESVKWLMFRMGQGDTATATITRFHKDSISISMADVGVKLALDAKGDVVGGTHLSQPWTVERKP